MNHDSKFQSDIENLLLREGGYPHLPESPIGTVNHIPSGRKMIRPETKEQIDLIMAQVQEFASAWALFGTRFGEHLTMADTDELKSKIRFSVTALSASHMGGINGMVQSQAQETESQAIGEVQHYAAPANLPAYVNVKWYGKPPKNGAKVYSLPLAPEGGGPDWGNNANGKCEARCFDYPNCKCTGLEP